MKKQNQPTSKAATDSTPEELYLELCDSKPSSYVMDGPGVEDESLDMTPRISFPSIRMIKNKSRMKVVVKGKNGEPDTFSYKTIRYINGCPYIDMEKQIKEGWKPNATSDTIVFRNGHLRVINQGDIGKFLFIKLCEYNTSAPNRPDDAEDVFKVIDTTVDAGNEEMILDLQLQAMDTLNSFKQKNSKGAYDYNEDAIQFLCTLFKIPSFNSGYKSEAWVALARVAADEPVKFLNSIASARALYEADVLAAINFGAIVNDTEKCYFPDGNKVVMKFDRDASEDQRVQALVDFMSNPKNKMVYDNLRVQLKNSKARKTEVIK